MTACYGGIVAHDTTMLSCHITRHGWMPCTASATSSETLCYTDSQTGSHSCTNMLVLLHEYCLQQLLSISVCRFHLTENITNY